jgi:hypothetical protein
MLQSNSVVDLVVITDVMKLFELQVEVEFHNKTTSYTSWS